MILCLFAIVLLVTGARFLRANKNTSATTQEGAVVPFVFGVASYTSYFLGLIFLAAFHVRSLFFFACVIFLAVCLGKISCTRNYLKLPRAFHTALGVYFATALFSMLGGITHRSLETGLTGSILGAVFAGLALRFRRASI